MGDAYIVDAVRTPRGKRNGSLTYTHPIDLAVVPLKGLLEKTKIDPQLVGEVIYGCVSQREEQDNVIAREAALAAGLPLEVPGYTVNRFCGSGLTAVNAAAHACMSGQEDLTVAGGVEHMTRVPMAIDFQMGGSLLEERYPNLVSQGISAEMIAERYDFTRRALDEYSVESQRRAAKAWEEKRFRSVVPVPAKSQDGRRFLFEKDEHMRPSTTVEALANLKPSFKPDGKIHAGNSSGIVDGAAAVLIASEKGLKRSGLKTRARIVATAQIGDDPVIMLLGPIPCTRKVLHKAGLKLGQMDLYEVNEAFAPVPMAWLHDLKSDGATWERLNVNGGAIALGHPIGATGAMLVGTILDELERTDKRYGLVTLCTGLGMAVAAVIERI